MNADRQRLENSGWHVELDYSEDVVRAYSGDKPGPAVRVLRTWKAVAVRTTGSTKVTIQAVASTDDLALQRLLQRVADAGLLEER